MLSVGGKDVKVRQQYRAGFTLSHFSRCCGFGVAFSVIIPYVVYENSIGDRYGCVVASGTCG